MAGASDNLVDLIYSSLKDLISGRLSPIILFIVLLLHFYSVVLIILEASVWALVVSIALRSIPDSRSAELNFLPKLFVSVSDLFLPAVLEYMGMKDIYETMQEEKKWRDNPFSDDVTFLTVHLKWPSEEEIRGRKENALSAYNQERPELTYNHLQTLSLRNDWNSALARDVITGQRDQPVPDFALAKISPQDRDGVAGFGRNLLSLLGARDHKELQPIVNALTGPCRAYKLADLLGHRTQEHQVSFSVTRFPEPQGTQVRVLVLSKKDLTELYVRRKRMFKKNQQLGAYSHPWDVLDEELGPDGWGERGSLKHCLWAAILQMARFGGCDDHSQKLTQERVFETTLRFPSPIAEETEDEWDYHYYGIPHPQSRPK